MEIEVTLSPDLGKALEDLFREDDMLAPLTVRSTARYAEAVNGGSRSRGSIGEKGVRLKEDSPLFRHLSAWAAMKFPELGGEARRAIVYSAATAVLAGAMPPVFFVENAIDRITDEELATCFEDGREGTTELARVLKTHMAEFLDNERIGGRTKPTTTTGNLSNSFETVEYQGDKR